MSRSGRIVGILQITPSNVSIQVECLNQILRKVGNRPFALFSINGPMRTGKSYILNKMVYYLQALQQGRTENWFENSKSENKNFNWRGGATRDTIGINVWSEPFIRNLNGREVAILLIDTQGSFDDQTSLHQNAMVFALSALLSSVLIYNVSKSIGEDVLQFLQCFTGFAKIAAEDENNSDDESFQKLVFLIRDMEYAEYKFGYYDDTTCPVGQNTRMNFKHKTLNPNISQPLEIRLVREQLNATFKDVGLYALPHPGKELARSDSQSNLDEEFQQHAKEFVELMFSNQNIKLKTVGGLEITGKDFTRFVSAWATLFQSNEMPAMRSVYETAAEMQNIIAMRNALAYYEGEMKQLIRLNPQGVDPEEFLAKHLELAENSFAIFRNMKRMGGREYESRFGEELQEKMEPLKEVYEAINMANARAEQQRRDFEEVQEALRREINETTERLSQVEEENIEERNRLSASITAAKEQSSQLSSQMEQMRNSHAAEIANLRSQISSGGGGGRKWWQVCTIS